jgi:hypothetical protein
MDSVIAIATCIRTNQNPDNVAMATHSSGNCCSDLQMSAYSFANRYNS